MIGDRDTIYAHSSGRPPAAIAVIRISGPGAHAAAERLCGPLPPVRQAGVRPLRRADGELLDEALVLRFAAPASATGEDVAELHCHGGRAVVDAVRSELSLVPGLREAEPGEFTRRAFSNGRMDLTEAEGLADLLEAETEQQRRAALAISGGAVRRQVEHWRDTIVTLSAAAEAAIDYVDEDEVGAGSQNLAVRSHALASEVTEWLRQPRSEVLKNGVRVVLAGPPNAGKSSLLNRLAGLDRAIVSEEAGTTRDVIEVPVAIAGIPFVLIDTAGMRESAGGVEQIGIKRAADQVAAADIVLWLGAPEDGPQHQRMLRIHGLADRADRASVPEGSLAVSSQTGEGINHLVDQLVAHARACLPSPGAIALNERQAAALHEAATALSSTQADSLVLTAEALRLARNSLDRVTGRAGVEDVLDALFGRFCLGK